MKNKFNSCKSKKYLLLFALVMLINTLLTFVLIRVSISQTRKTDYSLQEPVKVKIAMQENCPLKVTVINVDTSNSDHQVINYSIQNISVKPIEAYVLVGNGERGGRVVTNSFTTNLFQANEFKSSDLPIERETIKEKSIIVLSIDYVEFADGSSWGNDSQGKSQHITGARAGRKAAIKQLKELIKNQNAGDVNSPSSLLEQNVIEINVVVPENNLSTEWNQGYKSGYKSVISVIQNERIKERENLIKRLDEMAKLLTKEMQK